MTTPNAHTLAEAAAMVRPIDTLAVPLGPGQPAAFLHALGERDDYEDVTIFGALLVDLFAFFTKAGVHYQSGFYGPAERFLLESGADVQFVPSDFRRFTPIVERLQPRVMATLAAPPDADGWMSLSLHAGATVREIGRAAADPDRLLIVEINPQAPLTLGIGPEHPHRIHVDQADVLVNARLAADAVGATKMDRPEWCSTNVANGEIYFTLTNNSNRSVASATMAPDSANPRVYADTKNGTTVQNGNPNGHILRVKEDAVGSAALAFSWDVDVFGAESGAAPGSVNLSSLTAEQDFSSPDGLAFSPSTGIMWIQTDDGAYTDVTNCMMLASLPGQVGDGGKKTLSYTKADSSALNVDTYVGKAPGADKLKRFLVGSKDCEITGLCETPDGKAMFINIQHPGEGTKMADIADPAKYTSQWPSNAGYGAGKRPRSATIVITKNDGGRIGS